MKKSLTLLLAAALLLGGLAGCGPIGPTGPSGPTGEGTSPGITSELPASEGGISSDSPSGSTSAAPNSPSFDEKQFTSYMYNLCRFIHDPVATTDDLKKLDLFYLLVLEAQDYALRQGKTYTEDQSLYWFPLADLEKMSDLLFGFQIDFEPYTSNAYFEKNRYPANYFDSDTNEFNIVFAAPFYPAYTDGVLTAFLQTLSTKIDGGQVTAECQLVDSRGLGAVGVNRNATYQFKMIENEGLTYYQIKFVISDSSDSPLRFYSSLEDFPYAKLGYDDNRSILTRDGKGWLAAPGTFMFGDRLFSDGKIFFIQVYWANSSGKPEGDFGWLSCCFNDLSRYVPAPPPETDNKLFVRAEGHTVYTEEGESYTLPDIECPAVSEVTPLRFYSSLEDFPYAKLGYSDHRNTLTRDGKDWLAAPDMDIFGDHLFSDGKVLYIQVYRANSSGKPEGDFTWLSCCLSDPSRNISVLPPETDNKLFVRAKGYTAYTEDGESYSFSCGECD